jgi:glutamate 5-kinase
MVANLKPVAEDERAPAELFAPRDCRRLIVKIGSSLLVDPEGKVRRGWLGGVIDEIAGRRRQGQQIVIVSSGAIALGARRLGLPRGGRASLEDAQAAAAVGQIILCQVYAELLSTNGAEAAQILLTLGDLEDRRSYLNVTATVSRLLEAGAVPVINENDTVATEEIRFGDNDRLAARVAQAVVAQGVILLSDIDGLYTADPHTDPTARRLAVIERLTPEIEAMAGATSASGMGSGGMVSKLQAARIAAQGGLHLAIISGKHDRPISRFAQTGIGTVFPAPLDAPAARKRWLAGRITVRGQIQVDPGAVAALAAGKSLLPAGITAVSGTFDRGDVIDVLGPDGVAIARGLAAYSSAEASLIKGSKTADIENILGYAPRAAMIHRDYLVLLT